MGRLAKISLPSKKALIDSRCSDRMSKSSNYSFTASNANFHWSAVIAAPYFLRWFDWISYDFKYKTFSSIAICCFSVLTTAWVHAVMRLVLKWGFRHRRHLGCFISLLSFELGVIVIQILPVTNVSTTGDVWKIVWRIYVIILRIEGSTTMQMNELLYVYTVKFRK